MLLLLHKGSVADGLNVHAFRDDPFRTSPATHVTSPVTEKKVISPEIHFHLSNRDFNEKRTHD